MFYKELRGTALEAYNSMVSKLYEKAEKELGLPKENLSFRPLRPEDVRFDDARWYANLTSTLTWTSVIANKEIADARFVGISGVFNAEAWGRIQQIRIKRMGSDIRYWDVSHIPNYQDKIGYADDPVTIDQNTTVTIDIQGVTTSTSTNWGLIGGVVEKKGLLVSD